MSINECWNRYVRDYERMADEARDNCEEIEPMDDYSTFVANFYEANRD